MKVKGDEPPIKGYTDEDAFRWCIEGIQACLPAAEKHGILLALENHWGLTTKTENLLRIYKGVGSPWLGINMDTGNFAVDPYPEIEKLAPHAAIVQAKTYYGGGECTRWISTTSGSPTRCGRRTSRAGCRWRWRARRIRPPPSRRACRCLRKAFG